MAPNAEVRLAAPHVGEQRRSAAIDQGAIQGMMGEE
jgi:hypothetical protein